MRTVVCLFALCAASRAVASEWQRLPPLPDAEGFAAPFAGVSHGALLVAGGANFPGKKPWEGGSKVWYDTVLVLERPDGNWTAAGKLPRPLGYGVSVTHRNTVVCVGGSDAARHYGEVFRLEWKTGQLITTPLPSVPKPVANACGALVGESLYVAGGQEAPDSTQTLNTVYRLNLTGPEAKWQPVQAWPGPGRMLAAAASFDGAFWLLGGTDLIAGPERKVERRYLKDAYRYHPRTGWQRVADLPHPVVAAPSPAPVDETGFYLLGGDDGSQVGVAPDRHRGFRKTVLRFDAKAGAWTPSSELPAPRVTVPCVRWREWWVVPSGEQRPGIRSPEVWGLTLGNRE